MTVRQQARLRKLQPQIHMEVDTKNTITHVLLLSNYAPDKQFSMRRFTQQLMQGLRAEKVSVEIFLPPVIFGKLGAQPSGFGKWLGYIDKYLLCPILLKRKIRTLPKNSIVHICDHSNAIYTKVLKATPHLVTCHDLLAIRSALGEIPQNCPKWTGKQQQAMILKGLRKSRMIASVSEATRTDVSRLIGTDKKWGHYIPNSLDDSFILEANRPRNPRACLQLPQLPPGIRYLMHIGGEKWYKNRTAALEIFAALHKQNVSLHLIIVGPKFPEDTLKISECWEIQNHIHYLSGISDDELRDLYKHAEMLLFPSFMEGFGWPILEAQACGCPVVTLDIEPMRSLNALTKLAIKVDPLKHGYTAALSNACKHQLELSDSDKEKQQQAIKEFAAAFTNQASAKAYITLYKQLLKEAPLA